ncbi:MAG: OsmY domain-containing protein [Cupriavidus sp.]|jgi:osmotically-inducible protein OsmY|uniref:BON domain-containing protein n=1 Tax=Cupriavidus TaxID=106589 RepID=UPI000C672E09|nr:BON domain-containing protein [Cupriavidus pauculus]MBU69207.1 OsmY domain-containing protein [Cupriavidus sp.]MCM3609330.1 BON domain-containing protein [Cupriavidus pauculus]
MKTDVELKKLVSDELDWDPRIVAGGVGVEVHQGIVTLSGHVGSYSEKIAAERAVERISGVKGVVVKLEVTPKSKPRDEDVALAVRNALQWYVHVPADNLQVEIEKGWITLRGTVQWGFQRRAAEKAVAHIRGVVGVSNLIRVVPKIVPEAIEGKIESALRRHAEREAHHISIKATSGIVTLDGTVDSLAERRAVAGAAWSAPGVSDVVNNLLIR